MNIDGESSTLNDPCTLLSLSLSSCDVWLVRLVGMWGYDSLSQSSLKLTSVHMSETRACILLNRGGSPWRLSQMDIRICLDISDIFRSLEHNSGHPESAEKGDHVVTQE
jgi:hypothetical protein